MNISLLNIIMSRQRISEEIRDLVENKHVKKLQKISEDTYRLQYCPTKVLSQLYKDKRYTIQIIVHENYPEKPPIVRFVSKISHLNVSPLTGKVRMSVIENEWSPFLSLNSVIGSLDQILENPDKDYLANHDFQMIDGKNASQQNSVKICVSPLYFVHCDSFSDHIKLSQFQWQEKNQNNTRLQIEELPESSSQEFLFDQASPLNGSGYTKHQSPELYNNGYSSQQKDQSKDKRSQKDVLEKVNKMISLCIDEINAIQQQIKAILNSEVKQILVNARDDYILTLKTLLGISKQAKKKILACIKDKLQTI